jgi:hypothetical protein
VTAGLEAQLRENSWLWQILQRFDEVGLPDGWIVSGCIAQTVWNLSCGRPAGFGIKDIDLLYFDPADLLADAEADHERRLADCLRDLPVKLDIKNQARVHLWYERAFGYPISPYRSAADAIASFPTTATAVGVRSIEGNSSVVRRSPGRSVIAHGQAELEAGHASDLRGKGEPLEGTMAACQISRVAGCRLTGQGVQCRGVHGCC